MATLEKVSNEIKAQLTASSQIGRAVASDLLTLTRIRIFDKGIATDGSEIGTYSNVTVSIKKKKGRFTSTSVNLRDTGKLANSYLFSQKGKDNFVLGFAAISRGDGKTNDELVTKIEKQYGQVFQLTSDEAQEIDNIIGDFLDRIWK